MALLREVNCWQMLMPGFIPYISTSSFGLSVIEAMACGTPVVAFNKGSMPEVIIDNKTGFLVTNVKEACEKLDLIPTLKRSDCREWVAHQFSQERMVADYIKVYQRILNA